MNAIESRRETAWTTATLAAAALVLLAHVLLVAPELNRGELDLDEAGTFFVSTQPLHDVLTVPTAFHSQPPLFYLVLGAVARIADSEPVLRMVPWVFMLALGISILVGVRELSPTGRVAAAAVLLCTDYGRYLSMMVRPYSMSVFFAFWSCLLFWRLVRSAASSWWIWTGYTVTTAMMIYAVSMASGIVVAEALVAALVFAVRAKRDGVRSAFLSVRAILLAFGVVACLYLPFVLYAWSLRRNVGHASTSYVVRHLFKPRHFVTGPLYMLQAAYGTGFLAAALAVYGAWSGLLRRVVFVAFLIFIVAAQIAFSHGFLAGRSSFAFRYLAPAFPALCLLIGVGADLLLRNFRYEPYTMAVTAGLITLGSAVAFARADKHRVGPWRLLRNDLSNVEGKKFVFFDVGWDGQRLQYETRRDSDITVLTHRGTGWTYGGDLMTADYVRKNIDKLRDSASMFLYQYDSVWKRVTFDSAFVPSMEKLGCTRSYVREVPTYTRAVQDPSRGALVVGYKCHGR